MKVIDAKGQNCPIPVIMAKKEIDNGCKDIIVEVDNKTAVENLNRLASSRGYDPKVEEAEGYFKVYMSAASAIESKVEKSMGSHVIFVGKDYLGEGSKELGQALIKMFFYTVLQSDTPPSTIAFMNSGVKLTVENDEIIEHLRNLEQKGVSILVCGTCLNFFNLSDKQKIGTVSNMYDIVSSMERASKIISI